MVKVWRLKIKAASKVNVSSLDILQNSKRESEGYFAELLDLSPNGLGTFWIRDPDGFDLLRNFEMGDKARVYPQSQLKSSLASPKFHSGPHKTNIRWEEATNFSVNKHVPSSRFGTFFVQFICSYVCHYTKYDNIEKIVSKLTLTLISIYGSAVM